MCFRLFQIVSQCFTSLASKLVQGILPAFVLLGPARYRSMTTAGPDEMDTEMDTAVPEERSTDVPPPTRQVRVHNSEVDQSRL